MSGSVPSRPEEKCLQDNLQVRGNSPFTPSQAVAISPQGSTCESLSISSYSEEPRTEETGSKASVTKRKGSGCLQFKGGKKEKEKKNLFPSSKSLLTN